MLDDVTHTLGAHIRILLVCEGIEWIVGQYCMSCSFHLLVYELNFIRALVFVYSAPPEKMARKYLCRVRCSYICNLWWSGTLFGWGCKMTLQNDPQLIEYSLKDIAEWLDFFWYEDGFYPMNSIILYRRKWSHGFIHAHFFHGWTHRSIFSCTCSLSEYLKNGKHQSSPQRKWQGGKHFYLIHNINLKTQV